MLRQIALAIAFCARPTAASPTLTILAESRFSETGVVESTESLRLTSRLVDDTGDAIVGASVRVKAPEVASWEPCSGWQGRAGAESTVETDSEGRLCLLAPADAEGRPFALLFEGDRYHAEASTRGRLEPVAYSVRLDFESPLVEVSLDGDAVDLTLGARATAGAPLGETLPVRIDLAADEGNFTPIASAEVVLGGRARVTIPTRLLGEPGPGRLLARAVEPARAAEATAAIRKTATVTISASPGSDAADPSAGFDIPVGATSRAGAVPNGWVEATVGGRPVGMGAIEAGAGAVPVRFEAPRARAVDIELRYVPRDPWWLPGEPLIVSPAVRPPSAWARAPWFLAAGAIGYWILRAWRRPGRKPRPRPDAPIPTGRPEVELIASAPAGSGWSGTVRDAHDGDLVAGALLQILVPAFDGEGVAASATTGDDGSFRIDEPAGARSEGARLSVTAPHHSRLLRRLPAPGHLMISVITRRRALLERLVVWARSRGAPWASAGEPTPGNVARVARERDHRIVERWAHDVEDAAFGPASPDETRERALVEAEPGPFEGANDR